MMEPAFVLLMLKGLDLVLPPVQILKSIGTATFLWSLKGPLL